VNKRAGIPAPASADMPASNATSRKSNRTPATNKGMIASASHNAPATTYA
jgi:hypothetical protein